jgi:allene oxide cyclase-like protein
MKQIPLQRRTVALLGVPALAAVAVALGSGASAQDPGARTLTLKELEKGATFTHIRNTRTKSSQANPQGDVIVFSHLLADEAGNKVGKLSAGCPTTTGARNFLKSTITCSGVLALRDGNLMIQANVKPGSSKTVGAVTGGTGAYANARGVFVARDTKTDVINTITFAE